ncbi:MFS transporter [Pseudolysinimonas sp.]|uniref:MFS transporter n=1 Tax=Pseudolysinimonas sp. TaxID=2680009 RepID=UPI003F809114
MTSMLQRLRDVDPVLRILATTTLVATLGRGVFATITVLFLGFAVHLTPGQIAFILGAGAVVAIGCTLAGGHLADRVSARRLALVAMIVTSLSLTAYSLIGDFWSALVIVAVQEAAISVGQSARSAIIGRAFGAESRVRARAILRTVTNVGIAVGSGLGGIALALDTATAYRIALAIAGGVFLLAQLNLARLPARVDAPPAPTAEPGVRRVRTPRPGRSPWRDPRYLALSALSGLFAVQFAVGEFGVPLWVARDTAAPRPVISALLIVNTVLVIVFMVPLSRGTHRIRTAGRLTVVAGLLMAAACAIYAVAGAVPALAAVVVLVAAAAVHAFAEILSQAGGWGLSFELADPDRMGAYQGVFGTAYAVGAAVGPALITLTAIQHGGAGWAALGGILLAAALGIGLIARRAAPAQEAASEASARMG